MDVFIVLIRCGETPKRSLLLCFTLQTAPIVATVNRSSHFSFTLDHIVIVVTPVVLSHQMKTDSVLFFLKNIYSKV